MSMSHSTVLVSGSFSIFRLGAGDLLDSKGSWWLLGYSGFSGYPLLAVSRYLQEVLHFEDGYLESSCNSHAQNKLL